MPPRIDVRALLAQWGKPLAMQGAFFAVLGAGVVALRKATETPVDPRVVERPLLTTRCPGLASAVSQLAALGQDEAFEALLDRLCHIVSLDDGTRASAQWEISRQASAAVSEARALCRKACVHGDDARFQAAVSCEEDAVPQIQTHLDDLLHNHLLRRGE